MLGNNLPNPQINLDKNDCPYDIKRNKDERKKAEIVWTRDALLAFFGSSPSVDDSAFFGVFKFQS